MHRSSSSSFSSSSMFKLLLLLLIGVVILFSLSFMWCYSDKMNLTKEIAKLRKEIVQINKQVQQQHEPEHKKENIVNEQVPKKIVFASSQSLHLPRSITQMVYRVVVFTYLRPDGLTRLLASLKNSYYPKAATVSLTILVDFPKPNAFKGKNAEENKKAREDTLNLVNNFIWPHGPLVVHRRQANVGLKRNILESWHPSSSSFTNANSNDKNINHQKNEVSILLEDDIEVSPFWFDWASASVEKYYFGEVIDKKNDKLLGISLYRPIHDEQSRRKCVVEPEGAPFLLQQPCSWGAIYFPEPWRAFRDWYDEFDATGDEPIVITERNEEPDANTWAKASSWKKYLIRYMHENGLGMIYPNLKDRLVYSTNHLMKGEHPTPNRKLFELPLLDAESAKKIWPEKSDVVDRMVKKISFSTGDESGEEEDKEFLSILMNKNKNNDNKYESDVLPDLDKLRSFDVMFNEEKGGAAQLLQPKKNLANTNQNSNNNNNNHNKKHHHH